MKQVLPILFFLITSIIYCQTKERNQDFLNTNTIVSLDSTQKELLNQIKEFKTDLDKIKTSNDSLNKELLFYKVKEDYYSTALSDQSGRFTLIISGILALLALISFGLFKLEMNRIESQYQRKIETFESKIEEIKLAHKKTEISLLSSKGNLFSSIALFFKKEKNYFQSIVYQIAASKVRSQYILLEKKGKKTDSVSNKRAYNILANLNEVTKIIEQHNPTVDKDKKKLVKQVKKIKSNLDFINKINNDTVKNLVSKIRLSVNDIIK